MLSTKLTEVVIESGVKDLPLSVKAPFARALIAERNGDKAEAARQLDLAVAAEEKARA